MPKAALTTLRMFQSLKEGGGKTTVRPLRERKKGRREGGVASCVDNAER